MKVVKKGEGKIERDVLTSLIVNKDVLARFASKWDGKLFHSSWANTIAGWCFSYFEKYNKAPKNKIANLYQAWADNNDDNDTIKMMERFLSYLSNTWEEEAEANIEFEVDKAANFFNEVRLKKLANQINGLVDSGDLSKAEGLVSKYGRIESGSGSGVDVLQDPIAVKSAFEEQTESLITYKGALGKFFKGVLHRDGFVAFEGPEKRGKTWWLIDIAWRAMLQRRRTVYFAVGDMSQNQMMRRFITRALGRPMEPKKYKWPLSIQKEEEQLSALVEHEERETTESTSIEQGLLAFHRIMRKKIRSQNSYLKLSCHPNSSITVNGLDAILKGWERSQSWVPDVVVIDYADILAPPLPGAAESRDQVNTTWKQLRALSQARHCLVVTATQTDARSYDATVLNRSHFSEDKRKMAHVTGLVGLNQSEEEKEQGLMRLNHVVLRESDFSSLKCVHVAGCLSAGNPAIRSSF